MDNNLTNLNEEIINCRRCPRLVSWREQVASEKRAAFREYDYWGKPVPGFGDPQAALLVVGLAPGAHGSNRTGRMFTGDSSGNFLFPALHRAGFASQPVSIDKADGLSLDNMFITAICRCAPPGNKPAPEEQANCLPYLLAEMEILQPIRGIVALGRIAFDQVRNILVAKNKNLGKMEFAHGAFYDPGHGLPWLLASFHPSRQNTQTGRLTVPMFDSIWQTASQLLEKEETNGKINPNWNPGA